jgi:hypothetical protein
MRTFSTEGSPDSLVSGRTVPTTFHFRFDNASARLKPIPRFAPKSSEQESSKDTTEGFIRTYQQDRSCHDLGSDSSSARVACVTARWVRISKLRSQTPRFQAQRHHQVSPSCRKTEIRERERSLTRGGGTAGRILLGSEPRRASSYVANDVNRLCAPVIAYEALGVTFISFDSHGWLCRFCTLSFGDFSRVSLLLGSM